MKSYLVVNRENINVFPILSTRSSLDIYFKSNILLWRVWTSCRWKSCIQCIQQARQLGSQAWERRTNW